MIVAEPRSSSEAVVALLAVAAMTGSSAATTPMPSRWPVTPQRIATDTAFETEALRKAASAGSRPV